MNEFIFRNGATWLRIDFHLHTKADKEFIYNDIEDDYIKQYVEQLNNQQVKIGVITNHNKFNEVEYNSLRKRAQKESCWLLPGVELSVNDGANGIHCLIVFDKSAWLQNGEDYINQFLTSAFEGIANRENENTRCHYDLNGVLKKLSEHQIAGRDSFIILAHVEANSGFLHELNGGRIAQISRDELFRNFVLGFQKVRTNDLVANYRKWSNGNVPAFVEGSDCKDIEEIGRAHKQNGVEQKTFIKIGDFNFEALKYALLDAENRIRTEVPPIENSYIESIHFDGGKFDGQTIDFSPDLNSLIGIRGSGKSSILEIIRYALGISLSSSSADVSYKNDLISYILGSGGKVTLTVVDKHGENYRIEKIYGQKETIYDADNQVRDCSIDTIFELPVYFGQKDLSNKKEDFESDLLQRLIGSRLKIIKSTIEAKEREVKSVILEIQKSRDLQVIKDETEIAIKNAEQKLQYFKDKGVEDKLKLQTQFESDSAILSRNKETFIAYQSELQSLISNYDYFFQKSISGSESNKSVFDEANRALAMAKAAFDKLKTIQLNTNLALQKYEVSILSLNAKRDGMKEEFAKIKRELNSDTINPDTFLLLNRTIETSRLKLQEIDKLEKRRQELEKLLLTKLAELNEVWRTEFNILKSETEKVNEVNDSLRIVIEFKGQRANFVDKLKAVFRGTNIRESTYQKLVDNFQDFIEVYRRPDELRNVINENQIGDFYKRFNENISDLLTCKVDNKVSIFYKGKPLDKHSLGQRASALILFLLAQKENDVLIIDQPEDDLDNQTIYDEVIKELIKLKGKMQFIFATHNANIPVLGDSEKVLSCSFEDLSKIHMMAGSIDTPQIRSSIVSIMEGGEDAFNRRKEIYNIWKV